MTAEDAKAIAAWRYPAEYAFYDADADAEDFQELLAVERWTIDSHFAADNAAGQLAGFFTFARHDRTVDMGLGMRPDLTGQGLGLDFVKAGMDFAEEHFAPKEFTLSVAESNRRAIVVYERVGFTITGTFLQHTNGGVYPFVAMSRRI